MTTGPAGDEPAPASSDAHQIPNHFAWLRTRMSLERTLMAWIRTATALIGFGFTILQFFERLRSMAGVAPPKHPAMSRLMGLSLIAIGTLGLITAIAEYRVLMRHLWSEEYRDIRGVGGQPDKALTPTLMAALLLALVGIVTLGALVVRIE
jgi:putative membrane protein